MQSRNSFTPVDSSLSQTQSSKICLAVLPASGSLSRGSLLPHARRRRRPRRKACDIARATLATVDPARLAAEAAIGTRDQERKLGENCRKRQDAEGAALTALAKAQENEASTDRFDRIKAELGKLRSSLKTEGSVGALPCWAHGPTC
jgi:hypothetical protein